jgi:TIR domain
MKILISHAIEDEGPASLLKNLIERCSLKRIEVWFSSDQSPSGGVALGASWFLNLLQRLAETDMIVALITPRSVASPWLYFECGYLANRGKSSIVPLTLGLPISEIPMPLSAYQGHDLSVSTSVAVFLQKLFAIANVPYDEDMTRTVRETTGQRLLESIGKRTQGDSRSRGNREG